MYRIKPNIYVVKYNYDEEYGVQVINLALDSQSFHKIRKRVLSTAIKAHAMVQLFVLYVHI